MSEVRLLDVTSLRIEAQGAAARGRPPLLHDLSFDIKPGEFVALVGESGSGKTMAARAILDLLPSGVGRVKGSIRLEGRELTALPPRRMRDVRGGIVGMVFQEPMVSLNPALTIGRQLEEGLKLHTALSDRAIRQLCIRTLLRVRIADPERCLASYPHEFSGGMRQRIMLASVMMLKPRLLIADEPTTALDTLSQREVMELMVELARDNGIAVMLITHDLGLVARYAARVIVLEKGLLVEKGDTRQVLSAPTHPYTRKLVDSLPRRPEVRPDVRSSAPVILSIENACVDYEGKPGLLFKQKSRRVVHNVNLDVRQGEIVALVGGSGSGKTTLGRAVMGLRPLSDGIIRFEGMDIARMSTGQMYAFRRAAQLVFQDPFSALNPRMRVGEIIGATLRHTPGLTSIEKQTRIESTLDEVGLGGFADRYPHQMSGGQRQRISIARAIASRPRLVVADEPVSALDVTIQRQVLKLLQKLQAQYGFACLFITHDLGVVEEIATRVCVLSAGAIVEQGSTNTVFDDPQHDYTRALLAATPSRLAAAMSIE